MCKVLNICKLPKIDSGILFQSDSFLNSNDESDSAQVVENIESINIPLISFAKDCSFDSDNDSIGEFNTIQQNSKKSKFLSKNIIAQYFNDLLKREIRGPKLQTKEEIFEFIEPYSIENFASTHFRKQKSYIFFGYQSIEELTTFSIKPQTKPLLEKISITKKNEVFQLSTLILSYIGVLNGKKDKEKEDDLMISIVFLLREEETLIDEFFMQIIKTIRNSPNQESLQQSWKLFITMASLFYVKDDLISSVIRCFLIQQIFEEDSMSDYAKYTFIRFYERSVIGRNFDSSTQTQDIPNIHLGVRNGKEMFKCSLYTQMWNQRKKYPNLPIPLTLYLTVKMLIKNGVMITSHPFPDLGQNVNQSINSIRKHDENIIRKNKKEMIIKNDENFSRNVAQNDKNHKITKNENVHKNVRKSTNDENASRNIIKDEIKTKISLKKHHKNEGNKNFINDENETSSKSSKKTDKTYQRANMKIVKMWAMKLNENYEIINDGEVRNLLGLIFIWMLNLLDPIIPKKMSDSFIKLSSNDLNKCKAFVENMPLLHKNTLKYLIGFFREIAQNKKWTHETFDTIAENIGSSFVKTSFITIDPFTRKKMFDVSSFFIRYCLDNLDVKDVYPLDPSFEITNDDI